MIHHQLYRRRHHCLGVVCPARTCQQSAVLTYRVVSAGVRRHRSLRCVSLAGRLSSPRHTVLPDCLWILSLVRLNTAEITTNGKQHRRIETSPGVRRARARSSSGPKEIIPRSDIFGPGDVCRVTKFDTGHICDCESSHAKEHLPKNLCAECSEKGGFPVVLRFRIPQE